MSPTPQVIRVVKPFTGQSGGYVSVFPDADSQDKLVEWAYQLGFWLGPEEVEDLHCTVMYSKVFAPTYNEVEAGRIFTGRLLNFEYWEGADCIGYVVAVMESKDLKERNLQWADRGAQHSFPDYTPHVTLSQGLFKTPALLKRLQRQSDKARGSILRFTGECLQDQVI